MRPNNFVRQMGVDENRSVGGKWRLGDKLAPWSNGELYSARHKTENRKAIVKFERRCGDSRGLHREYEVYSAVGAVGRSISGFPRVHMYCKHGSHDALVMNDVRWTLSQLTKRYDGLCLKSVIQVGIQALYHLERLHEKGYIHGNVKPGNMMMNLRSVYLVNFEQAKVFRRGRSRMHVAEDGGHRLKADVRFASRRCHEGRRLSRRDDLESLGYAMVYMYKGRLPWTDRRMGTDEVYWCKRSTGPDRMCKGMTEYVRYYIAHVRGMGYDSKPDYRYLREVLGCALQVRGKNRDNRFEWTD